MKTHAFRGRPSAEPGRPGLPVDLSDTARWVAAYRAWESARPDALFHDPFAGHLAGELGLAIAWLDVMPRTARSGWPVVVRTKQIDDLVARSVREGCDRVLCLAAGFDTRPYRLDLPPDLEWVEADLPALIAEKDQALAAEAPRCRLRRQAVDLTDAAARADFLAEATAGAAHTLVITEGLLAYLDEQRARSLADALHDSAINSWVTDIASAAVVRSLAKRTGPLIGAVMGFGPADGIAFFEKLGWTVTDVQPQLRMAARWKRLPPYLRPLAYLPQPDPRKPGKAMWSAVIGLTRHQPPATPASGPGAPDPPPDQR